MRQRGRREGAGRRELVMCQAERERRVQRRDASRLEQFELREPVLDAVERLANVQPGERRVGGVSSRAASLGAMTKPRTPRGAAAARRRLVAFDVTMPILMLHIVRST
jgi:hypothetical protein